MLNSFYPVDRLPAFRQACLKAGRHGFDFLKVWPPLLYLEGWIHPFRMGVSLEILRLTAMVPRQTGNQ